MTYNHENAIEEPVLKPNETYEGVIVDIVDGTVKDHVNDTSKWSDPDQPAIEVKVDVGVEDKTFGFQQLFTYRVENGFTAFSPKSKLGQFKKQYGALPHIGLKVKAMTNVDGYLRLIF